MKILKRLKTGVPKVEKEKTLIGSSRLMPHTYFKNKI